MNDKPLRTFDRVADIYDQTRAMPAAATAAIADAIASLLPEIALAPHLLEVGIGTGRIAVPLAERGVRVTGTDISREMVARLRAKRRDIGVVFAEASRAPFRSGAFDGALFVDILHLVPDAHATVRGAMACLRAGGVLVMGADDRNRDGAEMIIAEAITAITGSGDTSPARIQRGIDGFERACAEAGIATDTRTVAQWTGAVRGRGIIDALRARTYSQTWHVPDAQIDAIVAAVEPRLAALYGDLDREAAVTRSFSLRIARLGA